MLLISPVAKVFVEDVWQRVKKNVSKFVCLFSMLVE